MPPDKSEDRRFKVTISYNVEELKNNELVPFFGPVIVPYHDMGYHHLVAMNHTMVGLEEKLLDFGIAAAEEMGLGKKLAALGIGKKDK